MSNNKTEVTVVINGNEAVIRRAGISAPIVANILGVDLDVNSEINTLYLDRLVHEYGESSFVGWHCHGAISTILKRKSV